MKKICISSSEWRMMELLWEEAPRTLTQLAAILREGPGWSKSTVNTMLTRMKAKGLLRVERGGRAQLFYPAVTREAAARQETDGLLERVYRGSIGLLMRTLVDGKGISASEMEELQEILRGAEDRQGGTADE